MPKCTRYLLILPLLFVLPFICVGQRDTLVSINNNTLVGEIKGMNKGVLKMKTGYSDRDFSIAWEKIKYLNTETHFMVSTTTGGRFMGHLETGKNDSLMVIRNTETLDSVPLKEIVYLRTLKTDFWERLSASISLGYNFTKSNNFRQFSLRSTMGYQAKKWSASSSYNNISSNRDDVEKVERLDASLAYRYFLRNDWFPLVEINWLSNTEQNINLRTVTRLGIGKYLLRTNQLYWGLQTGISYNNESFIDATVSSQNSAEAFLGTELNLYDVGDISLLTNFIAYPSITESGRLRFDSAIDLQYDLPFDFFLKVGFTVNFDNRSVVSVSGNYDYVIQTTFGWEL